MLQAVSPFTVFRSSFPIRHYLKVATAHRIRQRPASARRLGEEEVALHPVGAREEDEPAVAARREGRLVRTLLQGPRPAGSGRVQWDGTDAAGRPVGSGAYVATLRTDGRTASRVVALVK